MKNTGVLFANDVKVSRNKELILNLQRMGVNNCIVTRVDGRRLPKIITNCDRVLLDAPSTGLGNISRDHSIKETKVGRRIDRSCIEFTLWTASDRRGESLQPAERTSSGRD